MLKDYKYINDVLDKKYCEQLTQYLFRQNLTEKDSQRPNSFRFSNLNPLNKLLISCKDRVEQETGLELYPTYIYGRIYQYKDFKYDKCERL